MVWVSLPLSMFDRSIAGLDGQRVVALVHGGRARVALFHRQRVVRVLDVGGARVLHHACLVVLDLGLEVLLACRKTSSLSFLSSKRRMFASSELSDL
jgi:hypothetical protein